MTILPVRIEALDPSFAEVDKIPADIIEAGNPSATVWPGPPLDGDREVSFGVWSGEPGAIRSDGYPYDEVFVMTAGSVRLDSADGTSLELTAGQTGLIPAGWTGVWHTLVPSMKAYIIAARPAVGEGQ